MKYSDIWLNKFWDLSLGEKIRMFRMKCYNILLMVGFFVLGVIFINFGCLVFGLIFIFIFVFLSFEFGIIDLIFKLVNLVWLLLFFFNRFWMVYKFYFCKKGLLVLGIYCCKINKRLLFFWIVFWIKKFLWLVFVIIVIMFWWYFM